MSNFQNNTNAVLVASFPPPAPAREVTREDCELRIRPGCETYTRLVLVETPTGFVHACPACAERCDD